MLSTNSMAAIFGVDDRVLLQSNSVHYELSRSSAVAVLTSLMEPNTTGGLTLYTDTLDSLLCPEERFSTQISIPYACSGFLIAPNIIATAGHCMSNTGVVQNEPEMYCDAYSWLFDYNGDTDPNNVPRASLYRCKQIIYAINESEYPYRDYALIELDRPVLDRAPLVMSAEPVMIGQALHMIGHPLGAPAILSRNAVVYRNDQSQNTFITSLDAFSGNSGSAVFNELNQVVGILIAGTPQPDIVQNGSCGIYNRCDERGERCLANEAWNSTFDGFQRIGSEVQKLDPLLEILRLFQTSE
jgi:V8-like Glu-specific endopeptidase